MIDLTQPDPSLPPKVVVSPGQAIEHPKVLDLKSAAYPKLLAGAWLTFLLFLLFFVIDWLGNVRKNPIEVWVLYSEFAAMACAFACALIAILYRELKVHDLYVLMYAVLGTTAFFMSMFELQELSALKWQIAVSDEHQSQVLEPIVDSVAFRWFILLVCYGIFVPDPRKQRRKGASRRHWLLALVWPDRRLSAVLNVLALWPLILLAGIATRDGTLQLFARPAAEMTLWLVLARLVARYGPYQFDQLQDRALDLAKEGRYELREKIGEGGMGDVFLANDLILNRLCAYKIIRPKLLGVARIYERFQREVNLTAILDHPNIVSIFDFGAQFEWNLLLRDGIRAGDKRQESHRARTDLARAHGLRAAARSAHCAATDAHARPDSSRHQARQYHGRATARHGGSGKASRFRSGQECDGFRRSPAYRTRLITRHSPMDGPGTGRSR